MLIIGITGTLGAGKGTIVEYLVNNKEFNHYSVRDFLTEEIKNQGLPVNRDTMTSVANELRAKNSPSYIIDELYKLAVNSGGNCIIESIRTPGEVDSLKQKARFYLFAVDANTYIRYSRIKIRNSVTDQITYETFQQNEEREMASLDPNKQNLLKCREMADFVFTNNGTYQELYDQVDKALKQISHE